MTYEQRQEALAALEVAKAQNRAVVYKAVPRMVRRPEPQPKAPRKKLKPKTAKPLEPQTEVRGYVLTDKDRQMIWSSFRTRKSDTIKTVAPGGGRSQEWNTLRKSGKYDIQRAVIQLK